MGGGNSPQGGGIHLQGMYLTVAVNIGLVLAQVAFGAYHVIGKEALSYISPVVFAFYRECIAGPTLVIIAIIVERAKPDLKADWWRFVLLGATGVYMNQLFFILGLQWTSSDEAAIMQPCIPVFTTALTLILRMEKFSVLKIIGILFSAAGAVVMVGVENLSFKSEQFKGMMCLLGNTLAMSIYYILQKPVLKKYPPISVTGWAYIVGSVLMGVTSLIVTRGRGHEYVIQRPVIFPLAYSIVAATIFTYMTLTWANKHAPASVVAAYSSLQPLTAAILSYVVWRVVPTRDMYIGGAAIIVGLAIVTFARSREAKKEADPAEGAYLPINPSNNPSVSSSLYPSPNNSYDNNNNNNHEYIVPVSSSSKWGVNNNDNTDFQRKSFNNQSEISATAPVNR